VLSGLLFIGSAGEVELLFAQMFDENGLFVDGTGFDTNDLAAAFAKLDANFAAELPPECVQAWEVSTRPADRYNARDLKGLRDVFTDDAAIIDDRVIGWGPLDRDAFVDHLQQLLGMAPDAFLACVEVYEVAPHGSVGRLQVTGTVPEGGPFELAFECVNIVHGEKLARLELLPPGQVEEALRRFRACNPRPQPS
jgi:hypothetical protein